MKNTNKHKHIFDDQRVGKLGRLRSWFFYVPEKSQQAHSFNEFYYEEGKCIICKKAFRMRIMIYKRRFHDNPLAYDKNITTTGSFYDFNGKKTDFVTIMKGADIE
jgi:hypothetical protein